jgi:hypothetical protein
MTMVRPKGKAQKIAEKIMGKKGVRIPKSKPPEKMKDLGPYLQH